MAKANTTLVPDADDVANVASNQPPDDERPPPNYGRWKEAYDKWKSRNTGPLPHGYSRSVSDY